MWCFAGQGCWLQVTIHFRQPAGQKLLGWFSVPLEIPSAYLKLRLHYPMPGVFSVQSKKHNSFLNKMIESELGWGSMNMNHVKMRLNRLLTILILCLPALSSAALIEEVIEVPVTVKTIY